MIIEQKKRISKEILQSLVFGKLSVVSQNLPNDISIWSKEKFQFKCTCGNFTEVPLYKVLSGHSTTCGHCNDKSKVWWLTQRFGDLVVLDKDLPNYIKPNAHCKIWFKCTCGNEKEIRVQNVFLKKVNSCGNCSKKPKEFYLNKKFGKLILIDKDLPDFISPRSHMNFKFNCECNKITTVIFKDVMDGNTESCGRCIDFPKQYWLGQKFGKLTLLDIDLPEFLSKYKRDVYQFKCDCGIKKFLQGSSVFSGNTKSCGCLLEFTGHVSEASREMFELLKKYKSTFEFSVRNILPKKELDIYDPVSKLAIEYNGIVWHSTKFLVKSQLFRDYNKYKELKDLGIRYIGINSDEWENKKNIFLNLILNACGSLNKFKRIYNFEIIEVGQKEFQIYHDKWHYLSGRKVSASLYLLAKHKDQVIGGWSFKKVDDSTFDWNRAFWDHNYKAWNPHGKALEYALKKLQCNLIVTFSDNRLFDGSMYEKLGFKKVKELKPDYEYTDGYVRKHKFNFRVIAGLDEEIEAKKQGFFRIYDCGKVKWEYKKSLDK